jgi:hypothetical protein
VRPSEAGVVHRSDVKHPTEPVLLIIWKEKAMRRSHNASQVLERAQDFYSNSRELARDGALRARTFIHESPVLSAFLGVGTGFLLGWWMRRRD